MDGVFIIKRELVLGGGRYNIKTSIFGLADEGIFWGCVLVHVSDILILLLYILILLLYTIISLNTPPRPILFIFIVYSRIQTSR